MLIREATFGRTPCYIHVRSIKRPVASRSEHVAALCVIENEGRALRFVRDRTGTPVTFVHANAHGALERATHYLEKRFGAPRVRPSNDPPLRDERSGSSG